MIETEIKLRIDGVQLPLNALWQVLGMTRITFDAVIEENYLLDTVDNDLTVRGQILRVRYFGDNRGKALVTHKGPNISSEYLKRYEIEMSVQGDPLALFAAMGYNEVFYYKRLRHTYKYDNPALGGIVTWDRIMSVRSKGQQVGLKSVWESFLEIEGWDTWIDEVASKLGFTKDEYITKSYREIFEG